MVSHQSSRKLIPEILSLPRKRKWEDPQTVEFFQLKPISKPESIASISDIELHLETPLPLEWQQCLDIQSGKLDFYNTRTNKRTSKDPRRSPERQTSSNPTSLDLELNLSCQSQRKNNSHDDKNSSKKRISTVSSKNRENSEGLPGSSSWLAFEGDQKEMVATVCIKCNLLVMVCKSSPACPNCKFMNPLNLSPPTLFKGSNQ